MHKATILESMMGISQLVFDKEREPGDKSAKIGTIDPAYVTGDPKILFDGEDVLSEKKYPFLAPYSPRANDRVVLIPVGHSYVVLGAIATSPVLQPGWNHIASGEETTDFTIDFTDGGRFPAGTFSMLEIRIEPVMVTGNDFIVGAVNGISTTDFHNRSWLGKDFSTDGTTSKRTSSSSGTRWAIGYVSAQDGGLSKFWIADTDRASKLPMQGASNRGAPAGFEANREWMTFWGSVASDTLISSLDIFTTSSSVSFAKWYAMGYWVP